MNSRLFRMPLGAFRKLLVTLALGCAAVGAQADLTMPNTPLATGTELPPNIMFILDDSGSMAWGFMPGANDGDWKNYGGPSSNSIKYRAANLNQIWYDPTQTYSPAMKADGSSYSNTSLAAAYLSVFSSASTTSIVHQQTADTTVCVSTDRRGNCTGYQTVPGTSGWPSALTSSCNYSVSDLDCYPLFYVLSGSDATKTSSYDLYEFRLNTSGALEAHKLAGGTTESTITSFTWTTDSGTTITRTVAQEATNYANWFSYYRSRTLMAKSATSRAFGLLGENYRVGFDTIWARGTYQIPVGTDAGLFKNTNRSNWFTKLFGATASNGTPLRSALKRTGEYFKQSGASGPYGPESGAAQVSCRQNFAILTTDGYWNQDRDSDVAVGNADGTSGSTITSAIGSSYTYQPINPYKDGNSNTLADVAMYYWKTDLRPETESGGGLKNDVPFKDTVDPAFWQHMVTFGISIGEKGTLDPTPATLAQITAGTVSWPTPGDDRQQNIDDLWHAAVNSHGSFITAQNPEAFYTSLKSALDAISQRNGSFANVAATSTSLTTTTRLIQASYTTGSWVGEVASYPFDANGNLGEAAWRASSGIPAAASRHIYFKSGTSTREFLWSNLSSSAQTALGSEDVVNYLRGDRSKESTAAGGFRVRSSTVLGDVVDSSPIFDSTSNTVFFGANDGFLHAVNADTGAERFAVVPTLLFPDLKVLSTQEYTHRYFFDGDIAIGTIVGDGSTQRILVASLGRGGKGLIAVDITNVGNPAVLWEFSNTDLGLPLGRPVIAKTNLTSNPWVVLVGNGVNSANDKAFLFAIDLKNGSLMSKIDTGVASTNGLSTPRGWDADANGTVDYVYAGDLHGNLWKFDLSSGSPGSWRIATIGGSAQPLFQAKDKDGNEQPITGGVSIALSNASGPTYGKRYIFFGTGRYLTASDAKDLSTQSWYGIIDSGARVTGRSQLVQRKIVEGGTVAGTNVRTFSAAGKNADGNDDMTGKLGWYLDFITPPDTYEGERVIGTPQMLSSSALAVASVIPLSDPCSPGGRGWVNVISPFTGARINNTIFDLNNDGKFTSDDNLGDIPVSSYATSGGMTIDLLALNNANDGSDKTVSLEDCGSNTNCGHRRTRTGDSTGRISWREIIRQQ